MTVRKAHLWYDLSEPQTKCPRFPSGVFYFSPEYTLQRQKVSWSISNHIPEPPRFHSRDKIPPNGRPLSLQTGCKLAHGEGYGKPRGAIS